jgi:hypothetical protein
MQEPIPQIILDARCQIIQEKLHAYGLQAYRAEDQEHDFEAVCPHNHLHTKTDPEGYERTLRIFLNRVDQNNDTRRGKIFFSCRHNSCVENVWEDTLDCRLKEESSLHFLETPRLISPAEHLRRGEETTRLKEFAEKGQKLKEQYLDQDAVSANSIMAVSPDPVVLGSGQRNHPYQAALAFFNLMPPGKPVWWGDPETSNKARTLKTPEGWMERIFELMTSDITKHEEPLYWQWPGRFTAPCTFQPNSPGRYKDFVDQRLFVVCEADSMSPVNQRRVIMGMIKDPRFQVAYVLHSGGKSYHIGLKSSELSEETKIFLSGLSRSKLRVCKRGRPQLRYGGMGFDPMSLRISNAVRVPGPIRTETEKPQQLLYIDPAMGYNI